MRIIAGKFKGRRFGEQLGADLRPTTDKVREAIFSSLFGVIDLEGARVLDLYAGSGALGLEALSRGAAYCCFVEQNKKLCRELETLTDKLQIESQLDIVNLAVEKYCQRTSNKTFDLVLADPPYKTVKLEKLIAMLIEAGLVGNASIAVLEDQVVLDEAVLLNLGDTLKPALIKAKTYADTVVSFLRFDLKS